MTNVINNTKSVKSNGINHKANPHDIFDRIFKRIITLSAPTIIRFINGAFETDYPTDSTVTYNWTENVDDKLRKTIADTIITINETDFYHMEAQMYSDDESIILRVFDYGYHHAYRHYEDVYSEQGIRCGIRIGFPKQLVIYLDSSKTIPDYYSITMEFKDQGEYTVNIPIIKYQEKPLQEIIDKNLVILLPFKLLKVRNDIKKSIDSKDSDKIKSTISELREIYEDDIIKTIEGCFKNGSLLREDMNLLISLTRRLFEHLYSKYSDQEVIEKMLHDESLDLEIDRYIDEVESLKDELAKKDSLLSDKDQTIADKDQTIKQLQLEIEMLRNK